MNYIKERLDNLNFWIAIVGIILLLLGFTNLLFFCFIAMIIFPETHFRVWTNKAATKFREYND